MYLRSCDHIVIANLVLVDIYTSCEVVINGKIHVCIAYKTYAAENLTDLLHSQLITCAM